MGFILLFILSGKVVFWQFMLGSFQYLGRVIGGKIGLIIAFILVFLWTITQTYNGLLVFQLIVHGVIALILYSTYEE